MRRAASRVAAEHAWVAAAIAVGLLLSLVHFGAQGSTDATTSDSYEYLRGGQALLNGDGYNTMEGTDQVWFPPFYPIVTAAVDRLVNRPILSGRLVSLAASAVAMFVFYLLARSLCPGLPAVVATWLFALLPLRVASSTMVMSESVSAALVLAGLAVYVASSTRPLMNTMTGAILGAAYLTRPEGFLVFAVAVGGSILRSGRSWGSVRTSALGTALMVVGFSAVSLPYVFYLRGATGRWQLTGKTDVNLAVASAKTQDVPWRELKVLSADDTHVVMDPREAAVGGQRLSVMSATDVREESLRAVAKRVAKNTQYELLALTRVLSPFVLASVALGFSVSIPRWRPRGAVIYPALAAWASPLLFLPFFWIQDRFLLVVGTLVILVASSALRADDGRAAKDTPGLRTRVGALCAACAFVWMLGAQVPLLRPSDRQSGQLQPLVAAVRQASDSRGAVIGHGTMGKALAFATDRQYLPLPWASRQRVVRYAHLRGASFLLVTNLDHPELAVLAEVPVKTGELEPVARLATESREGTGVLSLYRVLPPPPRNGKTPAA